MGLNQILLPVCKWGPALVGDEQESSTLESAMVEEKLRDQEGDDVRVEENPKRGEVDALKEEINGEK